MKFQKSRIAYIQARDLLKEPEPFNGQQRQNPERSLPDEFLLLHFGKNLFTRNGSEGEFEFTAQDASMVIHDFEQRAKDLVIDYEHQSLSGNKAPAAGWIDRLYTNTEGLMAHIKYWTEEAADMLLNGEYRYFSPTLYFSRSGKNVSAIHSVALTNHPAMHGIPALVADDTDSAAVNDISTQHILTPQTEQEESLMESPDTAAEESKIFAEMSPEDQTGSVTLESIAGTLQSLTEAVGQLQKFFAEQVPQTQTRSETQDNIHQHFKTEQLLNQAYNDGKLAECHREWAYRFADTQPEAFQDWMKAAPRIIPDNCNLAQAVPHTGKNFSFTDEELKIFAMLGACPKQISATEKNSI